MENNKFTQLCVWPGVVLDNSSVEDFENFFKEEMDVRVKFAEEIKTLPDLYENNQPIPGTGDRNDVFFFVHDDDVIKFAIPRLIMGIRWWEDVVKYNDNSHLYTEEILNKYPTTW